MNKPPAFAELTEPDPGGEKEPGYDEWLRARIQSSVERDRAHPEERRTAAQVRAQLAERLKARS